ncbi:MAG TPA: hypothetical protein VHH34_06680 [Pseudonocardiaceae bacterium]|nr:hypothetical protein [Pseudonocardiaceae bacterium]
MPVSYPQPPARSNPIPHAGGGEWTGERAGRSASGRARAGYPGADPLRDAELVAIVDALRDPAARRVGVTRPELRERLGAAVEPGRFSPALRHAIATGLVLEVGFGRYALADPHP